jgi:hypothetical protein
VREGEGTRREGRGHTARNHTARGGTLGGTRHQFETPSMRTTCEATTACHNHTPPHTTYHDNTSVHHGAQRPHSPTSTFTGTADSFVSFVL